MTLSRSEVRQLLGQAGLAPRRSLGQNFLVDPNLARRLARLAEVGPGDQVVEVGAGLGSLTLALAETGAAVTALEVDRGLVAVLGAVVAARTPTGSVQVVEADAMAVDWPALLAGSERWVLVGNLPYNIATPLLLRVLEQAPSVGRLVVMVQSEVADRLLAGVEASSAYGSVSVRVRYWSEGTLLTRVPPDVFAPRPRVSSAVVRLRRRDRPALGDQVDYAVLTEVVRAGFAHRRKMLRQALAGIVTPEGFEAAGVRPQARAEELDLEAWGRLATWLGEGRA